MKKALENALARVAKSALVIPKPAVLSRDQALHRLAQRKAEFAQTACCAFDAYNSPKPKEVATVDAAKSPVVAPWREEDNTRYTGSCFVTILDQTFLDVFKVGGGLLEVKLDAPGVPETADLYAILSVERSESHSSADDEPAKLSIADQAFVPLPFVGYSQFFIRRPIISQLRIQLYDKVPQPGDELLAEQWVPLDSAPADWLPGSAANATFEVKYKDKGTSGHPVTVSAFWRVVPLKDCNPNGGLFGDRPPLQDIKKEYLAMKLGPTTPPKDRVLASVIDGLLPVASDLWAKGFGPDQPGPDVFAPLRGAGEPPLQPLAFIDAPGTDTQVWLQHNGNGKVVVAFRGTDQGKLFEWLLNLSGHPEPPTEMLANNEIPSDEVVLVHAGFNFGYETVRSAIKTLIKLHYTELLGRKPDVRKTIVVTGHSQGGGLASLAAYDLTRQAQMERSEQFFDDLRVYTFASPRAGNETFMNAYNGLVPESWRVHNPSDIVARLPNAWDFVDGAGKVQRELYFHVGANVQLGEVPASAGSQPVVGAEAEAVSRKPVQWLGFLAILLREYAQHRVEGVMKMPEIAEHLGDKYAAYIKQLIDRLATADSSNGSGIATTTATVTTTVTTTTVTATAIATAAGSGGSH